MRPFQRPTVRAANLMIGVPPDRRSRPRLSLHAANTLVNMPSELYRFFAVGSYRPYSCQWVLAYTDDLRHGDKHLGDVEHCSWNPQRYYIGSLRHPESSRLVFILNSSQVLCAIAAQPHDPRATGIPSFCRNSVIYTQIRSRATSDRAASKHAYNRYL
jgi:hypothetical protein